MNKIEKSLYNKAYRLAHLERITAMNKAWRLGNADKLRAYEKSRVRPPLTVEQKARRLISKKLWLKTPVGRFYKSRKDKRYFDAHKHQVLERMKNFYDRNKWIVAQIKNRPCADCHGWFESYQMEFDHRPTETKCFGISNKRGMKLINLMKEIKKCDIVCSNCHAKRTYERGQHAYKTYRARNTSLHLVSPGSGPNKAGMHEPGSLPDGE